jgi:hypothetical protein
MRRSNLIAIGLGLGLAWSWSAPPAKVRTPTVPVSPGETRLPADRGKPMELGTSDLGGLNALLPVGKSARKVIVPSIDEEGVLTSVTRMAKITRIDEDHFALENVVLTSFDAENTDPATGQPETTVVKISKGMYIASKKQLVSERPVHISRPGLEMTGESLIYWSVEGHAILKGHTEAILTDMPSPSSDDSTPAVPGSGVEERPGPPPDATPDHTPSPQ